MGYFRVEMRPAFGQLRKSISLNPLRVYCNFLKAKKCRDRGAE